MRRKWRNFLLTCLASSMLLCLPASGSGTEAEARALQLQRILLKKGLRVKIDEPVFMKVGEIKTIKTRFYTQQAYLIGVVGDESAKDVDVALYDHQGKLMAHDKDQKNLAVAATERIQFSHDVFIRFRMTACNPGAQGAFVSIVVGH